MSDLSVENHGSILILTPHTDEGKGWIARNIGDDALSWGTNGIVVEHRYIGDIVAGAQSDGLSVE